MIEEYSQHISMRMESGMKEEEAIDDFGNIDDLIAEILDAYHLDPEYEVKNLSLIHIFSLLEPFNRRFFFMCLY